MAYGAIPYKHRYSADYWAVYPSNFAGYGQTDWEIDPPPSGLSASRRQAWASQETSARKCPVDWTGLPYQPGVDAQGVPLVYYGLKRGPGGTRQFPYSIDGKLHYLTTQGMLNKIHEANTRNCGSAFWKEPNRWPMTMGGKGKGASDWAISADQSRGGFTHGYKYTYVGGGAPRPNGGLLPWQQGPDAGPAYTEEGPGRGPGWWNILGLPGAPPGAPGAGAGAGAGADCVALSTGTHGTRLTPGGRTKHPYRIDGQVRYLTPRAFETKCGAGAPYTPVSSVVASAVASPPFTGKPMYDLADLGMQQGTAGKKRKKGKGRRPKDAGVSPTTMALGGALLLAVGTAIFFATRRGGRRA